MNDKRGRILILIEYRFDIAYGCEGLFYCTSIPPNDVRDLE